MAFKFAPDSWIAAVGDGTGTLNFANRQINRENVLAPGEVEKSGANTLAGDDFIPAFIGYARIEGAALSSLTAARPRQIADAAARPHHRNPYRAGSRGARASRAAAPPAFHRRRGRGG